MDVKQSFTKFQIDSTLEASKILTDSHCPWVPHQQRSNQSDPKSEGIEQAPSESDRLVSRCPWTLIIHNSMDIHMQLELRMAIWDRQTEKGTKQLKYRNEPGVSITVSSPPCGSLNHVPVVDWISVVSDMSSAPSLKWFVWSKALATLLLPQPVWPRRMIRQGGGWTARSFGGNLERGESR